MIVDKIMITACCEECGNEEFYKDNDYTYYCTVCGEPHYKDDFNFRETVINKNLDIEEEFQWD